MKKILKVMLVIMMAVMVTACGGGDNTDSGDKKETKLLIGISPDYPPYESLNTKNEMEGFDIDMTKTDIKRKETAPREGMLYSDLAAALERVGDHATNIAFSILNDDSEEINRLIEEEHVDPSDYIL